jgi:membrane protein
MWHNGRGCCPFRSSRAGEVAPSALSHAVAMRASRNAASRREGDREPAPRRLPPWVADVRAWFLETFVGQCVRRIVELQPFDRALAIASRAFIAIFPLAIVVASLSPAASSGGFADALIERFGLEGEGATLVRELFASPTQVRSSTTFLGIIVVIYSVFSFARQLARMYEAAWHLPRSGVRGAMRGLVWVAGLGAYGTFLLPLRNGLVDHTGRFLGDVIIFASVTLVWLFSPYVLLAGRIPYRSLLPTAAATAVTMGAVSVWSGFYMPGAITTAGERYGLVGVAFSLVSWLIGIGLALLVAAAVGAVAAQRWVPPPASALAPGNPARDTGEAP